MSIFPKMTLTNKGKALEAKLKIGDTMEFTRMGLGSGEINKPIGELLNLINETASVSISNKQIIQEYTVQLRAFFTNVDVQERFYWREFGVFATDPDEGEILYAYSNAGDMGGWIPAVTDNRIERMIYASVQVSNAQEINITIPQSDTFIPVSEKGQPNGVPILDEHGKIPADNMPANTPTLGEDGKIPQEQLPDLNFDTAGSAAAVQGNLNAHINNKQNPHGVTAAQVGAYTKSECITGTTAMSLGLPSNATPNDAFLKLTRTSSAENLIYVEFTNSTTWTAPSGIVDNKITVLCCGGGGGGGHGSGDNLIGGGGGGGGHIVKQDFTISPGTSYNIIIGAGGAATQAGGATSFHNITAQGGQPGGSPTNNIGGSGGSGGSGGGGGGSDNYERAKANGGNGGTYGGGGGGGGGGGNTDVSGPGVGGSAGTYGGAGGGSTNWGQNGRLFEEAFINLYPFIMNTQGNRGSYTWFSGSGGYGGNGGNGGSYGGGGGGGYGGNGGNSFYAGGGGGGYGGNGGNGGSNPNSGGGGGGGYFGDGGGYINDGETAMVSPTRGGGGAGGGRYASAQAGASGIVAIWYKKVVK